MSHTSVGRLLQQRYSRSAGSVGLRSATRGPAAPSLKGVGVVEWAGLAAILGECESSQGLPAIERALARNALLWLRSALPRGR
jgi:hypothetical protein